MENDATRVEVLQWCVDGEINFAKPTFPPPQGWMWATSREAPGGHLLTAIFTNIADADVYATDVKGII